MLRGKKNGILKRRDNECDARMRGARGRGEGEAAVNERGGNGRENSGGEVLLSIAESTRI